MKFCSLGSGSKGNCFYVSDGGTGILVDAGLPVRTLTERLSQAGVALEAITALLFTHDHCDHYQGVAGLLRKHPSLALYANEGTADGIERAFPRVSFAWRIFESRTSFDIGPLKVTHPSPCPITRLIPSVSPSPLKAASWVLLPTSDAQRPHFWSRWQTAMHSSLKATTIMTC